MEKPTLDEHAPDTTKPVDIAELEEALDIDGAKEIAAGFLEDVASVPQTLAGSIATRNKDELRRCAHMLKGCCRIIMARRTAELAKEMESSAMEANWENAEKLLPPLLESFTETVNCLHDYLN